MITKIVWFVGAYWEDGGFGVSGIYSDKDLAIEACLDRDFFMIPVILDKPISDQEFIWYYGLQQPNFEKPEYDEEDGEE